MLQRIVRSAKRLLAHPSIGLWLAGLAVLVSLPALNMQLYTDDLILVERLRAPENRLPSHYGDHLIPEDSHTLENVVVHLFTWVGPDKEMRAVDLMDDGIFPWWTSEEFLLDFARPLSSFTHWVDYQLWPDSPIALHAHGILWFGLVVFVLTVTYRRLQTPAWIAGLAALLYAVDQNLFFPVAWLANRNVLLAMIFGLSTLLAHDRWRRKGSRTAAVLAPILFTLALLSGEPGVAIVAYLGAYAIFLDTGSWRARAASLLPAFLLTVVWRLVYRGLGFGALDTGFYMDPGSEPLRFLWAIVERAPILLVGQLGWPRAAFWEALAEPAKLVMWGSSVAFLAVFFALLWPRLRHDATTRFWAFGMLIAVLPVCATSPVGDRRLWFVGIGGMALVAQLIAAAVSPPSGTPSPRWRRPATRVFALGLLGVQLVLPIAMVAERFAAGSAQNLSPFLDIGNDPRIEEQEVILVTAPDTFLLVYLPWERAQVGAPIPARLRNLAPAFTSIGVTRTGPNELVLEALSATLMTVEEPERFDPGHTAYSLQWSHHGFWGRDFPEAARTGRDLPGMSVDVTRVDANGLPERAVFSFDRSLEDSGYRWLYWNWKRGGFEPFVAPKIGATIVLAGPFSSDDSEVTAD